MNPLSTRGIRQSLSGAGCAIGLVVALSAGQAAAEEAATASKVRFATSAAGPFVEGAAVFEGADIDAVVIGYDYEEASGERYGVSVIAPGGLQVFSSRQSRSGSGSATVTVEGAGIYRNLTSDLYETLRSSRVDADRLAAARLGLQEYILQLQANATRANSALELLSLVAMDAERQAARAQVVAMVQRFAELSAQARATDPDDVDKIQSLARQIAQRIGQDLPQADALKAHAEGMASMPIPATDRASDQPYDVLVTVDDFAAVSGEFRVFPPVTLFLPRLSQREATR